MRYPRKKSNDYAKGCPACQKDQGGLGRLRMIEVVNKWRGELGDAQVGSI